MTISCQVKELWILSEKDWLNLTNGQQGSAFFYTQKNTQEGRAFIGDESFPLKQSLDT